MTTPANTRYKKAKFVTLLGAAINTLLGVSKLLGGFYFHSSALIADGFHSLSDLFTDGMVLVASKYGSLEADDAHPYGHQRIETAATYVLALLLVLTGVAIAWDAIMHLRQHDLEHPAVWALPLAAFSIIANEMLFWYTRFIGQSIQSKLIIANAWHHRSDAASSLVVLIGISGSLLGYPILDSIAALIVGILIIKMGFDYGWRSIKELIDTGVDAALRTQIEDIIKQTDGVTKVHQLRTRLMGSDIFVDVHVQVNPMISVSEGHFIAQNVHFTLMNTLPKIKDVTVHIDPEDDEVTSPCLHLPNRATLEAQLLSHWQDMPEMKACLLHYLDGKLTLDLIGEFDATTRKILKAHIDANVVRLNMQPASLCIRIQAPAQTFYENNQT
ncbi:MAG: cation diffusion facilitator family transporter [Legionellaceae bacterium]|nr:cation diffusion facilitator family transporter [Legionellaceae bacterium]